MNCLWCNVFSFCFIQIHRTTVLQNWWKIQHEEGTWTACMSHVKSSYKPHSCSWMQLISCLVKLTGIIRMQLSIQHGATISHSPIGYIVASVNFLREIRPSVAFEMHDRRETLSGGWSTPNFACTLQETTWFHSEIKCIFNKMKNIQFLYNIQNVTGTLTWIAIARIRKRVKQPQSGWIWKHYILRRWVKCLKACTLKRIFRVNFHRQKLKCGKRNATPEARTFDQYNSYFRHLYVEELFLVNEVEVTWIHLPPLSVCSHSQTSILTRIICKRREL